MENYTIAESYTLPSKGLVYDKPINPEIKLRSMTTEEEMKRLGKTEKPNKMLAEIIDDCLLDKLGISSYDLCISDFQFLMHKLRVVTYGKNYTIRSVCPICGNINEINVDLDTLAVTEYNEKMSAFLNIKLPVSGNNIKLKVQTPRDIDEISSRTKDMLKKSPDMKGDPAFLFTLTSLIDNVDGEVLDEVRLESFVRKLPMKDVNFLLNSIKKFNFGLDTNLEETCKKCGGSYHSNLPITGEFFGPTVD